MGARPVFVQNLFNEISNVSKCFQKLFKELLKEKKHNEIRKFQKQQQHIFEQTIQANFKIIPT